MSDSLPRETLRILRFIKTEGPVFLSACVDKFGSPARDRVVFLEQNGYIEHLNDKSQSVFGRDLGYVATDKGINCLIDSTWLRRERIRDSILIPIAVSVLTTLGIDLLKQLLQRIPL